MLFPHISGGGVANNKKNYIECKSVCIKILARVPALRYGNREIFNGCHPFGYRASGGRRSLEMK